MLLRSVPLFLAVISHFILDDVAMKCIDVSACMCDDYVRPCDHTRRDEESAAKKETRVVNWNTSSLRSSRSSFQHDICARYAGLLLLSEEAKGEEGLTMSGPKWSDCCDVIMDQITSPFV
jgi:hypothetical protein